MHRHVEAERFHVRLSPGAASFSWNDAAPHADTLGENRLQARGACVDFSHAGEDTGNNDRNARPPRSLIDLYDLWRLNVERGDAFAG